MNKKINQFCEKYGLEVDKNTAYGKINGFEVNLFNNVYSRNLPFVLQINFYASEQQKVDINAEIYKKKIKFLRAQCNPFGIEIGLNDMTLSKLMKRIDSVIEIIFQIISENGALGSNYCPVTGTELNNENVIVCDIDNVKVTLSQEGKNSINSEIEKENTKFENTPKNYLKGFGGIFIGTIVGVVIFIIVFFIGYISAWSSLIAIVLGTYLYKKFGGRPDKVMVLMSSLTTIVSFVLSVFLLYVSAASGLAIKDELNLTGINAFNHYIKDPEFAREFYTNLILTFVFTLIGTGIEVYYLLNSVKRKKSI